jgi:4-hydroxy-tetrahydrodipicolinate synthase
MSLNLKGTGVAIITPFSKSGEVDYTALSKLLEHIISNKVEYVVVLGTTGESVTLNKQEKKEVVAHVVKTVNKRVPVVLGLGGSNTAEIIEGLQQTDLSGISAILSVSPYYNKPTQEGIYQHYKAISERSPLPIILYNVPGRTASNMTSDTTLRLAKDFKNIIAIKEASGNLEQAMRIIQNKPKDFLVISGDDNLTLPIMAAGGDGVISVLANAYPFEFSEMVRKCLANDYNAARALHYKTFEFTEQLFADGNPGGIKAALKVMGICEDVLRLPLVQVNDAVYKKIEEIVKKGV